MIRMIYLDDLQIQDSPASLVRRVRDAAGHCFLLRTRVQENRIIQGGIYGESMLWDEESDGWNRQAFMWENAGAYLSMKNNGKI